MESNSVLCVWKANRNKCLECKKISELSVQAPHTHSRNRKKLFRGTHSPKKWKVTEHRKSFNPLIYLNTSFLNIPSVNTMEMKISHTKQQHRTVYFEKELCKAVNHYLLFSSAFWHLSSDSQIRYVNMDESTMPECMQIMYFFL